MTFLEKDDILILEKNNGTVKRIVSGKIYDRPLIDLNVSNIGERGLVGIAASKFDQKGTNNQKTTVFLLFTESPQGDGFDRVRKISVGNSLYKFDLSEDGTKLINGKLLMKLPRTERIWHYGGKMKIGPDNNLYFTVGDLAEFKHSKITNTNNSIEPDGRAGILRIMQNGDAVKDGFSLGDKHPLNKYFAYGIRTSFGLDFDPVTGYLWDSEVGPAYGEEINLVKPGFNSGWSKVQGYWEPIEMPDDFVRGNFTLIPKDLFVFNNTRYSPPELTHLNHTTFTAIKFLDSDKLGKNYKNTLFVAEFNTGKLYNFKLTENRTSLLLDSKDTTDKIANTNEELDPYLFAEGFGGIVDIQVGPDGYLYVLSLYHGGDDCPNQPVKNCYYSLRTPGTIFRIMPLNSKG